MLHRFFEEVTRRVWQRMALPHMRNLILGWRIIDESLENGVEERRIIPKNFWSGTYRGLLRKKFRLNGCSAAEGARVAKVNGGHKLGPDLRATN